MKIVQSSLAKTHLAELLDEVERGETVQITRHGKIIARLVPENADAEAARRQKAFEELRAYRASLPKTGLTLEEVLEWRHEGHRY
ncbi:MAG: type II toxin-antitoxin system prevent-host-death family antitoxin [Rhizobiaceae bacterium]